MEPIDLRGRISSSKRRFRPLKTKYNDLSQFRNGGGAKFMHMSSKCKRVFFAYRPILPFKVTLSHADRGRKKASPTPKNRIGWAQLCYSTCCTWVGVAHPSTNQAQHCLTSVIEWELVFQCGMAVGLLWNSFRHLKLFLFLKNCFCPSILEHS